MRNQFGKKTRFNPSRAFKRETEGSTSQPKVHVPVRTPQTPNKLSTTEKGFLLMGLCYILLIFASLGILGLSVFYYWNEVHKARHQCLQSAFKKQTEVAEGLNDLLALNPLSKKLHRQHTLAKAQLAAALASQNPVAIQAARTYLARVKAMILALDSQQKLQIQTTNWKISRWHFRPQSGGAHKLHLKRQPKTGLAPQYFLKTPALKAQALWQSGSLQAHTWIGKFLDTDITKNWRWHCGASLEQRRKKWIPRLIEAKSLLNSSSLQL